MIATLHKNKAINLLFNLFSHNNIKRIQLDKVNEYTSKGENFRVQSAMRLDFNYYKI